MCRSLSIQYLWSATQTLSIVYSILKVVTQQGDKHTIIIERQGYKNGKTFVDKCIGIAVVLSNRL